MKIKLNPVATVTAGLVLSSTLYVANLYAQISETNQVSNEIRSQVASGISLAIIIAKEIQAGRDPALVVNGLVAAKIDRAAIATAMISAMPNSIEAIVKAVVAGTATNVQMNNNIYNTDTANLAANAPMDLMKAIVMATPENKIVDVVKAALSSAGTSPSTVFALASAIGNDARPITSLNFSVGTVVAQAIANVDFNKNQDSQGTVEALIRATALASPANYTSIMYSLGKQEAVMAKAGINVPGVSVMELAIKQTMLAAPKEATNIVTYGLQTVALNSPSKDLEPRMNLALRGAMTAAPNVEFITKDPNTMSAIIRQAITSGPSYASEEKLVTSMTKYATAFLGGTVPSINSPADADRNQAITAKIEKTLQEVKATGILLTPSQSAEINAIDITVKPTQQSTAIPTSNPTNNSDALVLVAKLSASVDSVTLEKLTQVATNSPSITDFVASAANLISVEKMTTAINAGDPQAGNFLAAVIKAYGGTDAVASTVMNSAVAAGIPSDVALSAAIAGGADPTKLTTATASGSPTASPSPTPAPAPVAGPAASPSPGTSFSGASGSTISGGGGGAVSKS